MSAVATRTFSQDYLDYLSSPQWKAKREEYFKTYGRQCQVCGTTRDIEVDHLDYSRLGHELLTDLLGLCAFHHRQVTAARREAGARSGEGYRKLTERLFGIDLESPRTRATITKLPSSKRSAKKKRPHSGSTSTAPWTRSSKLSKKEQAYRAALAPQGRVCAHDGCLTVLSRYNAKTVCKAHVNSPRK